MRSKYKGNRSHRHMGILRCGRRCKGKCHNCTKMGSSRRCGSTVQQTPDPGPLRRRKQPKPPKPKESENKTIP